MLCKSKQVSFVNISFFFEIHFILILKRIIQCVKTDYYNFTRVKNLNHVISFVFTCFNWIHYFFNAS